MALFDQTPSISASHRYKKLLDIFQIEEMERVSLMETIMSKNIFWFDTLSIFFPEVIILCLSHVKMKKKKI
jgi:hypothetical protein